MLHLRGKAILSLLSYWDKGRNFEYHGNIAVLWRNLVHSPAVHNDLAAAYTQVLQSCAAALSFRSRKGLQIL